MPPLRRKPPPSVQAREGQRLAVSAQDVAALSDEAKELFRGRLDVASLFAVAFTPRGERIGAVPFLPGCSLLVAARAVDLARQHGPLRAWLDPKGNGKVWRLLPGTVRLTRLDHRNQVMVNDEVFAVDVEVPKLFPWQA